MPAKSLLNMCKGNAGENPEEFEFRSEKLKITGTRAEFNFSGP